LLLPSKEFAAAHFRIVEIFFENFSGTLTRGVSEGAEMSRLASPDLAHITPIEALVSFSEMPRIAPGTRHAVKAA